MQTLQKSTCYPRPHANATKHYVKNPPQRRSEYSRQFPEIIKPRRQTKNICIQYIHICPFSSVYLGVQVRDALLPSGPTASGVFNPESTRNTNTDFNRVGLLPWGPTASGVLNSGPPRKEGQHSWSKTGRGIWKVCFSRDLLLLWKFGPNVNAYFSGVLWYRICGNNGMEEKYAFARVGLLPWGPTASGVLNSEPPRKKGQHSWSKPGRGIWKVRFMRDLLWFWKFGPNVNVYFSSVLWYRICDIYGLVKNIVCVVFAIIHCVRASFRPRRPSSSSPSVRPSWPVFLLCTLGLRCGMANSNLRFNPGSY